jgi:hypothetical protein
LYHRGYKNKHGYIIDNIKNKEGTWYPYYEHSIKWIYFNGGIPDGYVIDHIVPVKNGGTNKLSNLRLVTPKGNANNELTRNNISESHKGKKQTEETKKKRSDSMKGKLVNYKKYSKQVCQYTLEGKLIAIYPSTAECERNGFCRTAVRKCCDGTYDNNNTYKNYIWKWL